MAKPTSTFQWATNANYAASSQPWASSPTKVPPASGVQAEGHNPEDPTVAQYENWWKNGSGQWFAFIDSLFDASTNLTLPTNASVTVSGTGAHKRGSKVRKISVIAGQQTAGTAMTFAGVDTDTHDAVQTSATNNKYKIPIIVDEGERITNVSIRARTLNAGDTAAMKVFKTDITGATPTTTQLGSTATTSAPPSTVTLSSGALTETVGSTAISYYVEITCSAFNAGTVFYGLLVTTDIP